MAGSFWKDKIKAIIEEFVEEKELKSVNSADHELISISYRVTAMNEDLFKGQRELIKIYEKQTAVLLNNVQIVNGELEQLKKALKDSGVLA